MSPTNGLDSSGNHQEDQSTTKQKSQASRGGRSPTGKELEPSNLTGTEKQPISPTRRPLTRSQSGIAPKRYRDSPEVQQKTPRKKMKSNSDEASSTVSKSATSTAIAPPRQISLPKRGHTPESANESSEATPNDRPPVKQRANLPVPVPNLTKKSRGRRVPTQTADDPNPIDASRIAFIAANTSNGTFGPSTHMRNHLKVHRDLATSETSAADEGSSSVELHRTSPSPLIPDHKLQSYYSSHIYEPPTKHPQVVAYQSSIASFRTFDSEPVSLRTNMAVSSLRTEIPQSPPRSRA
ncbi:hypothetical protein H0H92_001095 [Tricholoma furcatifolium]|nr:hypothetical protein H0H92_001095 [Tricholoma furcatifolium]